MIVSSMSIKVDIYFEKLYFLLNLIPVYFHSLQESQSHDTTLLQHFTVLTVGIFWTWKNVIIYSLARLVMALRTHSP